MPEKIVNVDGEAVLREEWLKRSVFKYQPWSPLGAHVEALIYINQGLEVPSEVYEVPGVDVRGEHYAPSAFFTRSIFAWNSLSAEQKQETKEKTSNKIFNLVADKYCKDILAEVGWVGGNAFYAKAELLKTAVALRSGLAIGSAAQGA